MNLFSGIPAVLDEERIETLCRSGAVRIERILSRGHASPEGFWYDQETHEWVALMQGRARLRFADREAPVDLAPGDTLWLPAGCRHRVEWTDPDATTIWLAVHVEPGD